jgi:hypothetical protein
MSCQTCSFAQGRTTTVCKPDISDQKFSSHICSFIKFNFYKITPEAVNFNPASAIKRDFTKEKTGHKKRTLPADLIKLKRTILQ